mgnify:CR=1 FL=1
MIGTILIDGVARDFRVAPDDCDFGDPQYPLWVACHRREDGVQPLRKAHLRATREEAEADAYFLLMVLGKLAEFRDASRNPHPDFRTVQAEIASVDILRVRLEDDDE